MQKNNIISDWLDQYGDPEIDAFVEKNLAITDKVLTALEAKELRKAAKNYKQYQEAYDEAKKKSVYDPDWQQKFLLKQLAIKLKKEQMSKQQFKTKSRKSVFSEIGEYCYLSKEHDYIEVTEWTNRDGFDVDLSSLGAQKMSITWGQFKLLKKLVKQLEKEIFNDLNTDSSKDTFGL